MKLASLLLLIALFYLLYSFLIHLEFQVKQPGTYIWNLVGLLVSASHFYGFVGMLSGVAVTQIILGAVAVHMGAKYLEPDKA